MHLIIRKVVLLASLIISISCSSTSLTKEGRLVKLTYESPSKQCKKMDFVHYSFAKGELFSCDYESVKNTLRNKAAVVGANYVKLGEIQDTGVRCNATGEAYKCP